MEEGDLLYTIDPRDYSTPRSIRRKAQVRRDAAALEYTRANLDRGSSLVKNGFIAKDTFDQRTSAVSQAEATLAMSEAAVRTAELNVAYTKSARHSPGVSVATRRRSAR